MVNFRKIIDRLQQLVSEGTITEDVAKKIYPDFVIENEDERIRKALIRGLSEGLSEHNWQGFGGATIDECIIYLEKLKEQKPADNKAFEDNTVNVEMVTDPKTGEKYPFVSYKDQLQKPAEWSEENDAFLKVAIAICNRYSHKDIADWLKCLPERFNPQPKQEWNEEDEKGKG